MKHTIKCTGIALLALSSVTAMTETSSAMPIASITPATAPAITYAAWGCGPGWHPNPWGRCVPNGPYWGGWGWRRYGWGWHRYGWGWRRGWHRW